MLHSRLMGFVIVQYDHMHYQEINMNGVNGKYDTALVPVGKIQVSLESQPSH